MVSCSLMDQTKDAEVLPSYEDEHGGIIVEMKEPMDPNDFALMLRYSLSQWKLQGKKGVWIKLPIKLVNLAEAAIKEGFLYHHAEPHYLMLVKWIPETPSTIPANATHRLRIGAIIMNDKREKLISMVSGGEASRGSVDAKSEKQKQKKKKRAGEEDLLIEGHSIGGLSIAGHETCVIVPSLNLAFDIGKCPQRAISQQFLFISHGHMDHIGGLPMYVATRGLYRMAPPTIIVPKVIKENVEKIFEAHRAMDRFELAHTLVGLDVGEEFYIRKDLKVRAFKTYHVIPSQGYIVYSVRHKLKQEYVGRPGTELKILKLSGIEITDTHTAPEIAFTGDTTSDFITDADNADVLRAKILIMESTYVENLCTVEDARDYGHTHLSEIISHADRFQNKAILLIHFSARYQLDVIENAISALPPPLAGRVFALTNGFGQGRI